MSDISEVYDLIEIRGNELEHARQVFYDAMAAYKDADRAFAEKLDAFLEACRELNNRTALSQCAPLPSAQSGDYSHD